MKPYKTLPDGTRVYAGGARYKPKAIEDRLIGVNKPEVEGAVRFHTRWFTPLPLLAEDARVMPVTRSDEEAYEHMTKRYRCKCEVCQRPSAVKYKKRWQRDQGLRA